MRFNKLYEKKAHPEQTAVSSGVQELDTDQWMGTYKWSKDVAGHDGKKQHAPESPSGNDVYTDKPVVVGFSDADDKMTKAAMNGKVKQTVASGSEEPKTVNKSSPLSKNESIEEGAEFGAYYSEQVAQEIFDKRQDITSEDEILNQAYHIIANDKGQRSARYMLNYDADFPGEVVSNYFHLQKQGVEEAQNIYHLNRTGFARGPRDSERHDLDVRRSTPQEWALKINGKVWSKDGKAVTFNSKEQALKVRQSLLAKRPELEVGLVTRGGTAEDQGVAEGAMPPSPTPQWSDKQNAKRQQSQKEKAKAQFLKKKERQQGVAEAHGNSKIYDKCWDGYRKVPGKTRGEPGSCEKIKEDDVEEASTADMRAYFAQTANQNPIKPTTDKRFQSKQEYLRWLEQQKSAKKESTVDEDVIYRLDKDNPMNDTEVLVIGGAGRYSLDGLRAKARREAEQLAKDLTIDHGGAFRRSAQNVRQLQNTLNTIVAAYDELSRLRKLGGVRSKGIKDEDATVVREGLELMEKWTQKYKNSINCSNPKGFSQKAHCAGKKK